MEVHTIVHGSGPAWPEICRNPYCQWCSGVDRPSYSRGNTGVSFVAGELGANPLAHILLDFGAGTYQSLRRTHLPMPGLILLTHSHPDHVSIMELDSIARAMKLGGK